ncbi:MAG TPA: hypothetical protein GXZ67_09340 [Clostridiaceae bacterium]|nr:hypothetical protein [Clostridiaceae bacterium]
MNKKLFASLLILLYHINLYFADYFPPKISNFSNIFVGLAIPIFAYAMAVGFLRTSHSGYYFMRIAIAAVLTQSIQCFLLPLTGVPYSSIPLNPMYALLLAFGLLYGLEMILPYTPDKIATLKLLEANPETKSTRFDMRISNDTKRPPGMRVPQWPDPLIQISGVFLVVLCLTLPVIIPVTSGLFFVLTTLLFYVIEKCFKQNKMLTAFICFFLLDAAFLLVQYRYTGQIHPWGASAATVVFCFMPNEEKRPSRKTRNLMYAFFPLHILVLLLVRILVYSF